MYEPKKILKRPSDITLAAALFSLRGADPVIRVSYALESGERVVCTVTSINTNQGQFIVKGSQYSGEGEGFELLRFYVADLVGMTIEFE